jgi:hypothetical protein
MAIYRGIGSAVSTTDQTTIDQVSQDAYDAGQSATAAALSESSASSSASSASSSASAAATSETNAAASETAAAASETAAAASETAAAASETAAAASETNAAASETAAAASETAAAASETAAAASETAAASSETNAAASETAAAASETAAASSETNAAASETAAEAAKDAALAALDNFDDRYLGQKTSDPTLDNDGDALVSGALYFNTVDNVMKVYDGSQWLAAYASVSGALIAANNLSDLVSVSSARTNLGLGTAATTASTDYATAAQGALADTAIQSADLATVATTGAYSDLTGAPTAVSSFTNDAGYITSFSETNDLTASVTWANVPDANITQSSVTQHQAALSITESQISDLGSYLTAADVSGKVDSTGDSMTGNLSFGDNDKAIFGAGSDLQIYHDGTHSYVRDEGTGGLILTTNGAAVYIQKGDSETSAEFNIDGAVNLRYDNAQKLATTSTGIDVTGSVVCDGATVAGAAIGTVTTDNDLSFNMNATNNFKCTPTGSGTLTFTNITSGQSGNIWLDNSGGYVISAASTTYISAADLTAISTAGKYYLSYYSDGTNVMVSASAAVTSAGA